MSKTTKKTNKKETTSILKTQEVEFKFCPKCEHVKTIDDFHKHSGKVSGKQSYCKVCMCESAKKYYRKAKSKGADKDLQKFEDALVKFFYGATELGRRKAMREMIKFWWFLIAVVVLIEILVYTIKVVF